MNATGGRAGTSIKFSLGPMCWLIHRWVYKVNINVIAHFHVFLSYHLQTEYDRLFHVFFPKSKLSLSLFLSLFFLSFFCKMLLFGLVWLGMIVITYRLLLFIAQFLISLLTSSLLISLLLCLSVCLSELTSHLNLASSSFNVSHSLSPSMVINGR